MLYNETYLGHRIWNRVRRNKKVRRGTKVAKPRDEWIIKENAHQAIIDAALWEGVERQREQVKSYIVAGRSNGKTAHSPHLLTGVLVCGECGSNMHASLTRIKGREWRYYRCSTHSNKGKAVCDNGKSVPRDKIEDWVLGVLRDELLTPDTVTLLLKGVRTEMAEEPKQSAKVAKRLKAGLNKADKEIANLTAAIKAGGPIEQLVDELKASQGHKMTLKAELDSLHYAERTVVPDISREAIVEAINDLKGTLEFATPEERRSIVRENVSRIDVSKKGEALMEANPEGLLSELLCVEMVTPRGVEPPLPD
jgi:site-specific DNA recombinase